ncbi:MAG: xanthine dehydrogenase family protein subunit M [Anaerolineae bacterium]|nr:xanthine dehydrogenase family protein subunit M [Anaerolineae bacterium]
MKPFQYRAPTLLGEALSLLASAGQRARALAGGTDLLVQMRRGLINADLIVDVKKVFELNRLDFDPSDGLTIGAAVPLCRICESPEVAQHYPGLVDALSIIGSVAVRSRATVGGNLCNAAPSADSIPALIVHGAVCTVASREGTRQVPVARFCTGPGQTVLGPGELLVSVRVPPPRPRSGARYLRFTPRYEMDIAVVGVAAWLELSEGLTTIANARIALGAVAPTPLLAVEAGASLVGRTPSAAAFAEAAALAQSIGAPISDVRGTAAQRRHLVGILTRRALEGALQRARGAEPDGRQG